MDTNHVSHFLAGHRTLQARIRASQGQGDIYGISMTVLGELYYAVYASQRQKENLTRLKSFLDSVLLWEFDRAAAEEFGRIQAEQKAKGKPIPPTDAQIAAVARVRDLTVLSDDVHFTFVDRLRVENWLKP
uniref:PilT domain protein n=1 Tax=Acetithermum autotrophicum TaxID=1446466 RepID=H5SQH7_ACEAU|nr:PilT domain protein [Candidatus Acetothermum autotrophicum]